MGPDREESQRENESAGGLRGGGMQSLSRSTGQRLLEVAKLVFQDKGVPWFHRAPFYMTVVFALLMPVLPLMFLAFRQPEYAFGSLWLMFVLLAVSLAGVFWAIKQYLHNQKPVSGGQDCGTVFDQRGQQVENQTNIAGDQRNVTAGESGQAIGSVRVDHGGAAAIGANPKVEIHQHIQSPTSVFNSLHQLRAPVGDFTGRAEELKQLLADIGAGAAISGWRGMGGVGKTELAMVVGNRLEGEYPDAQFLIDLRGTGDPSDPDAGKRPLTVGEALAYVIQSMEPMAKLPEEEEALRSLYLSLLHGKRAIVLADNAYDAAQVRALLPPEGCLILVTSRHSFAVPGLQAVRLDCLSEEEANELLRKICPRIGKEAGAIAKLCGYLPLALRAAGGYLLVNDDAAPNEYAEKLSDEKTRLAQLRTGEADIDVEASLNLSYRQLEEENPQAAGALRLLSVFADTFDAAAAEAVCGDAGGRCLRMLLRYSLAEFEEKSRRYRLHDLVRVFAAKRLAEAGKEEEEHSARLGHAEYYHKVLAAADELYMKGGEAIRQGLGLFDAERVNIEAAQRWAATEAETNEAAAHLANTFPNAGAYVLNLRLHPRTRIQWLDSALAAARKLKDRRYEGNHLGNLGNAYKNLGEARKAIEYYEQALIIDREIGDRRGEGAGLGNLGIAYADLGETRKAIEHYEQALIIDREIGDRRGEGNALGNLGIAYKNLSETRKAIEYYEQRLVIAHEIGDRRGEGNALWNMALARRELKENAEAIRLAEAAFRIFREIEDPNAGKVEKALAEWRKEKE